MHGPLVLGTNGRLRAFMKRSDDTASWSDVAAGYQRAIRSFDEFVKPVLAACNHDRLGLTHVLFLITIGDRPQRVADLIKEQRYPGSNASYALSHLVEAGLVSSQADQQDARVRVVTLTKQGNYLLRRIRSVSAGDANQIAAALNTISAFEAGLSVPQAAE